MKFLFSMLFAVVTLALAALASAATNCSLTVSVVHGPLAVCLMRHNIDGHQLRLSGFGWCCALQGLTSSPHHTGITKQECELAGCCYKPKGEKGEIPWYDGIVVHAR